MKTVTVLYFSSLRDAARVTSEVVETDVDKLRMLYCELRSRHGFALSSERLRVAVDGAFADWDDVIRDQSEVAFIPPVSGG